MLWIYVPPIIFVSALIFLVVLLGKKTAFLKKRGEIIEDMDIMIAATCISNNLILITSNKKHFQRVKGLEVLSPEDFEN